MNTHPAQKHPSHRRRRLLTIAAVSAAAIFVGTGVATAATPAGKIAPVPTPAGQVFTAPTMIGQSTTYNVRSSTTVAKTTAADGTTTTKSIPVTETVTMTRTAMRPSPVGALTVKAAATTAAAASGCVTATFGRTLAFGLVDMHMRQTWCFGNGFLSYWPPADCWGATHQPTYHFENCNTSQIYGYGWNQGRTSVHASVCTAYVPWAGACFGREYWNNTYYFSSWGAAWRL